MWTAWKSFSLATALMMAGSFPAYAQTAAPGATGGPGGLSANAASGGGFFESQSLLSGADSVFDTDSDSIDFEDGTLNWKGRTFNMGNNRILRARFERYLQMPPSDSDVADYQAILNEMFERLSTSNQNSSSDENLFNAWSLLFDAAEYDLDGANSLVIANQVFNAWRVREEQRGGQRTADELRYQRKLEQQVLSNRTRLLDRAMEERQEIENRRARRQGQEPATPEEVKPDLSREIDFRAADIVETEAKIAALNTQMAANAIQAKLQFQSTIVSFIIGRRFEHALLASGFYRQIFRGSAMDLEVGKKEMAEMMPVSNMMFTVDTLDLVSREALTDIDKGMAAIIDSYQTGNQMAALERMQETFFLGEHSPKLLLFDQEKRRQLNEVYRAAREVQQLIDLKDYATVEAIVEETLTTVEDFPAKRILAGVSSAKRMSNLSLYAAQQAFPAGQIDKGEQALQRATEIWPLNPKLEEFTRGMADRANVSTQATIIFDEIHSSGDYRQLYERRAEFGFALMNDEERLNKLQEVTNRVAKIEFGLTQAQEAIAQDNPYAAWDLLVNIENEDPNDRKLLRKKADLAPRVAIYVSKLEAANRSQDQGHYSASLNHYLAAQQIHPTSRIARLGVEETTELLLDEFEKEITGVDPFDASGKPVTNATIRASESAVDFQGE